VELQELAWANSVDVETIRTRGKKGWQGQQKGILAVLWERGWIDKEIWRSKPWIQQPMPMVIYLRARRSGVY
jgi:hypothetical protein